MKIKINIDIKVGKLVKFFVLSDFFLLAGWGFIEPIFSVFIVERVAEATLATVGIAAAIYWILKSVLEIPIANYLDRVSGEKDDFRTLIGGLLLSSFSAFAFAWVTTLWGLYLVQAIHAVAFALYVPSWSAIFSRHLDKDRVSLDWSFDSTVAGIAAGITGLFAGFMAQAWGFIAVFMSAGVLSLIAAFVLILSSDLILPKPIRGAPVAEEHTPTNLGV